MELDCGSAAANALAALVRGRAVDCTIHGHDGQGRPVGDCAAAGKPLSVALVQDGWARAEAAALREPEATARAAGRGVWHDGFVAGRIPGPFRSRGRIVRSAAGSL